MSEDTDQLRQYAEHGSQDAFAGVARKYLPLIYRAALRRVHGDVHRAEDITQLTFVALARNAAALARHPDLTGWLFTTTRFLAAKSLRTEQRRQSREQEAYLMQGAAAESAGHADIAPLGAVLDEVLMELKQLDRQMLLLRFHRGLRLAEIGRQLDVTENAVQKRLDRALDELKVRLGRRGVTSTATALAIALEQQAAVAVPAGLTAAALGAVLACGTTPTGTLALTGLMALTKLQAGLAAGLLLAGTAGLVWLQQDNTHLRTELNRQTAMAMNNASALRQQISSETNRAQALSHDLSMPPRTAAPPSVPKTTLQISQESNEYSRAVQESGRRLIAEARFQEAVELYIETYRDFRGMRDSRGEIHPIGLLQMQSMMNQLAILGKTFPAALGALRDFRDVAEKDASESPTLRSPVNEFSLLNMHLKDDSRNVAMFDSLPMNDARKQDVGTLAYDQLVRAQRYRDALVARPFATMMHSLDSVPSPSPGQSESSRRTDLGVLLRSSPSDIEVLTALGRNDEARVLTAKLLEIDGSESMRARIQQAVSRATQAPAP